MVIKNRERALVRELEFRENQSVIVEIPQDNFIRRISLHGEVVIASGATPAVGIKNGGLLNLVKRIQVRLNGSDDIFDVDLKSYFYALLFEYGTQPKIDAFAIPGANTSSTFRFTVPIDFALIRNQISDYSALLPANFLDSVDIIITWGAIGDIVTTVNNTTVGSATKITNSMIEVYSNTSSSEEIDEIARNLTKVYEGIEQVSVAKAYNSFPGDELPAQVRPVPARHLSHVLFGLDNVTDNDPSYSDSVINQLKLENVQGGGELLFFNYFRNLIQQQKLDYKLVDEDSLVGMIYLDWVDLRNGGLDNFDVDAIKYKFLTSAPAASKINGIRIYKKYIPQASA